MANCEYRRGSVTDAKVAGVGNMGVAISGDRPICMIKVDEDPIDPACELPGVSTVDCPIAQYRKGNVTLVEANKQLTNIFDARKAQRGSQQG